MNVFIVTEAGTKIGFGHLTRCTAFYQAFRRKGVTPTFIINGDSSVKRVLEGKKTVLKAWHKDLNWMRSKIAGADLVIVDSYLADRPVYEQLSSMAQTALYIDDNKRLDYPRGFVHNGSVYGDRLKYPKRPGVKYLLGPEFALLREEFCKVPQKKIKSGLKHILVTFGGSDFLNLTPQTIKILSDLDPKLIQSVVVAKSFTNQSAIRKLASRNVRIFENSSAAQMRRLMLQADVAIAGAGQTLVELSRVGVPTVGVCVADNQKRHLRRWCELGFYGIFNPEKAGKFQNALLRGLGELSSYARRLKVSNAIRKAVNPRGTDDVVELLMKNSTVDL